MTWYKNQILHKSLKRRFFLSTHPTSLIHSVNYYFRRRQWHPLQHSCLENPMDGGAWWAAVHGIAKSQTRLSDFTFTFHFPALEKEMATHSSILAWRIPGMGEPGGLPSMGSHRVGHDWSDLVVSSSSSSIQKFKIKSRWRNCGKSRIRKQNLGFSLTMFRMVQVFLKWRWQ